MLWFEPATYRVAILFVHTGLSFACDQNRCENLTEIKDVNYTMHLHRRDRGPKPLIIAMPFSAQIGCNRSDPFRPALRWVERSETHQSGRKHQGGLNGYLSSGRGVNEYVEDVWLKGKNFLRRHFHESKEIA